MMPRIMDATDLIKCCPFRTEKNGALSLCAAKCALYIGEFPYGHCALYVTAINTMPRRNADKKEED